MAGSTVKKGARSKLPSHQVVVITDPEDAHIPFVQKHLSEPMIIIDPQAVLQGTEMSFELKKGGIVVTYGGVCLDSVSGVWYRKPQDVTPEQLHVPEDLVMYSLSTLQNHTAMIQGVFSDALWVSDYYAIRRASNKALQLEAAKRLGFRTPRTIMTSDSDAALAFVESEGECIVKSQCAYPPNYSGPVKSFLATRINKHNPPDFTNLHFAPSIFQQYIDTLFDVRVTVVGEQVFAAIIRSEGFGEDSSIRDWRAGYYKEGKAGVRIEAYEDFPVEVARMCVAHSKALGLNFSAIDLVMDRQNKLWFLENNSNGQWGFVEDATVQPIGQTMARLLTGQR